MKNRSKKALAILLAIIMSIVTYSVVTTASADTTTSGNKYLHVVSNSNEPRAMGMAVQTNNYPANTKKIQLKVKASKEITVSSGLSLRLYNTGVDGKNKAPLDITYTTEWNTVTLDVSSLKMSTYHSYAILIPAGNLGVDFYYDDLKFLDAEGNVLRVENDFEKYDENYQFVSGAASASYNSKYDCYNWAGTAEILAENGTPVVTTVTTATTTTTTASTAEDNKGIISNKYLHIKSISNDPRAMSVPVTNQAYPIGTKKIQIDVKASKAVSATGGISLRNDDRGMNSQGKVPLDINYTTEWNTVTLDVSSLDMAKFKAFAIVIPAGNLETDFYYDNLKFLDAAGTVLRVENDYEKYDENNKFVVDTKGVGYVSKKDDPKNSYYDCYNWAGTAEVLSDITFSTDVKTVSGASIRLGSLNGIRFYSTVNTEKLQDIINAGYTVKLGTIIAPTDLITSYSDLINDESKFAIAKYSVDVTNVGFEYYDGVSGQFVGSLVNIKDGNISRDFVARGYVEISKDGKTYYEYATGDTGSARSLKTVASALKTATDDTSKALYQKYQAQIDSWAEGNPYHK